MNYPQRYVIFNNSVPGFANRTISFVVDGGIYNNRTANDTGFISFNYTGAWSSHRFEWITGSSDYDLNKDGAVNVLDLNLIGQNMGKKTFAPYPDYDVDGNGNVDMMDIALVAMHFD